MREVVEEKCREIIKKEEKIMNLSEGSQNNNEGDKEKEIMLEEKI